MSCRPRYDRLPWWLTVYANMMRGIDFLCSRDEVDPKRIMVADGSQGGGLSMVLAGLYVSGYRPERTLQHYRTLSELVNPPTVGYAGRLGYGRRVDFFRSTLRATPRKVLALCATIHGSPHAS